MAEVAQAPRQPLFGGSDVWRLGLHTVLPSGKELLFAAGPDRKVEHVRFAIPRQGLFTGYVDEARIESDSGETVTLVIRGWALGVETLSPPSLVVLVMGAQLVSLHRVIAPRPDVVEVHPTAATEFCGFTFKTPAVARGEVHSFKLYLLNSSNEVQVVPLVIQDLGDPSPASVSFSSLEVGPASSTRRQRMRMVDYFLSGEHRWRPSKVRDDEAT